MINIALLGHDLHNDNLGVGALTAAHIQILRTIAKNNGIELKINVIDGGGNRRACVSGPEIVNKVVRPLRQPLRLFKVLKENDLVLDISGGDSFADIYTNRRLFIIFLQKSITHFLGKPLIVAPQTIGPFAPGLSRRLAIRTLRKSAVVATRDAKSTTFIRQLGLDREIIEASDVALKLPYIQAPKRPGGPVRVGLNVSGLLMQGGYDGKNFNLTADYPRLIREIIKGFLNHPEHSEVHLVAHVISCDNEGTEDDYTASLSLSHEFPDVVVAPQFETPSDAKSYISDMDFFMGARMHACIAAFSTGVPVVPMAYSRKFEGLFGTLGYDYTVDCTTDATNHILSKVFSAFENRRQIAQELPRMLEEGLLRLKNYEDVMERMLLTLSDR